MRLFEYGGPDKLIYGEYDLPPLGERDVLVKNFAGSVSRWDVKYRAGDLARYQLPGRAPFPLPQQLGREAAGEVVAVGSAVKKFRPGDRVIGVTHPEDPDGVETARGLGNLSRNLAIPGHQAFGSYAQYLVRDERMWLPLPDGIDYEQAGVALWPFSSSHRVVHDRLARAARRYGADRGRLGRHGPGDAATVQARRRARHCGDAPRQQGRRCCANSAPMRPSSPRIPNKPAPKYWRFTGGEGVDHAVDYTGSPDMLRLLGSVMRLGGSLVVSSEQGREPMPFTASDMIRLELNLLGIRGARMNDMLAVLKLLGERPHQHAHCRALPAGARRRSARFSGELGRYRRPHCRAAVELAGTFSDKCAALSA